MDLLLHRIGWSVQVPSRKATERDEEKIATWKDEQWPVINKEGGGPQGSGKVVDHAVRSRSTGRSVFRA
ncbi:winged helix-turn-helix domain-containing protein [Streptomyces canus]|uniref:helix-turn-helix domain-containing protein n=1 Tax=Streptomyces canus TaxID=58343 RepID=UPI00368044F6